MVFVEFKNSMYDLICFTTHQANSWREDFDKNNLGRWVKKGLLLRLRRGLYTFPEFAKDASLIAYCANQMYKPSYISLQSVLAFYNMIPEAVIGTNSVTTLKTMEFSNLISQFYYKTLKADLYFGYEFKRTSRQLTFRMAKPEKALLDFFYLYPFYETSKDMKELRFNEEFLHDDLNHALLEEYLTRFKNIALENRISKLYKSYGL